MCFNLTYQICITEHFSSLHNSLGDTATDFQDEINQHKQINQKKNNNTMNGEEIFEIPGVQKHHDERQFARNKTKQKN